VRKKLAGVACLKQQCQPAGSGDDSMPGLVCPKGVFRESGNIEAVTRYRDLPLLHYSFSPLWKISCWPLPGKMCVKGKQIKQFFPLT